jgi:hypothetical protein
MPWVQPWGGVSAPLGLPRNASTGRPYSGINILILWSAVAERGFTGQQWLTFRQALKLGAHVRKGERGTTVVYADRFIPYRERTRAAEAGDEPEAIRPAPNRRCARNAASASCWSTTSRRTGCRSRGRIWRRISGSRSISPSIRCASICSISVTVRIRSTCGQSRRRRAAR